MMTDVEVAATLDRLRFVRSHSERCRRDNKHDTRWGPTDNGTRCHCPFYSCGVHDLAKGFERRATGEFVERKARDVVAKRLRTGDELATLKPVGVPVKTAIDDFLDTLTSRELSDGTIAKYTTLMNQLQKFCEHTGYMTIQAFATQDAMDAFWKSWSDPDAGYKKGTKWRKNSRRTCKDNLKTMRLFFRRCMKRKWIAEDPTTIIETTPEPRKKSRGQVKYLTRKQVDHVMFFLDRSNRTDYQKQRLKALMLVMRWTGLRISDAVALKKSDRKNDVRKRPANAVLIWPRKPFSGEGVFGKESDFGCD